MNNYEDITNGLNDIDNLLSNALIDNSKFKNGNATAGKRIRANMQQIKILAQNIRQAVSTIKNKKG